LNAPVVDVQVWVTVSSLVTTTVVPTATTSVDGRKAKLRIASGAVAGTVVVVVVGFVVVVVGVGGAVLAPDETGWLATVVGSGAAGAVAAGSVGPGEPCGLAVPSDLDDEAEVERATVDVVVDVVAPGAVDVVVSVGPRRTLWTPDPARPVGVEARVAAAEPHPAMNAAASVATPRNNTARPRPRPSGFTDINRDWHRGRMPCCYRTRTPDVHQSMD